MKSSKTYRFLAILLILVQLIFLTLLVREILIITANIEDAFDTSKLSFTLSPVYAFYFASVFLSIALFLLFNRSAKTQRRIEQEKNVVQQQQSEDSVKKEELQRKKEEEAKIDYTVNKILTESKNPKSLKIFTETVLENISKEFEIVLGIFFVRVEDSEIFKMEGRYAFYSDEKEITFKLGEGISGQVAKDKRLLNIKNVPSDYIKVLSGLGNATPKYMMLFPIFKDDDVIGLIELASFKHFDNFSEQVFGKLMEQLGEQLPN